jgi:hypothetical protein
VTLHGPTNFAPTISHVAMMARESKRYAVYLLYRYKSTNTDTARPHHRYAYHVLLIITDGDITDMQVQYLYCCTSKAGLEPLLACAAYFVHAAC